MTELTPEKMEALKILKITPHGFGESKDKETIRRLMVLLGKAYNERDELKAAIERVRALVLDMESARIGELMPVLGAAMLISNALDEKGES